MATPSPESLRQFVLSLGDQPRSYPTLNVFGNLITPIITGSETAGGLVVLEGVAQPKSGPPLHVHHREDEAFYVVEGKFLFEYGDTRVEGGPTECRRHGRQDDGYLPARWARAIFRGCRQASGPARPGKNRPYSSEVGYGNPWAS